MGQKINPKGFRLGTVYTWDSRWFAENGDYQKMVVEDVVIREMLEKKLKKAGLTKIEIERSINKINIVLHVVRPGMVIGRGGSGMEELKTLTLKTIKKHQKNVKKDSSRSNNYKLNLKVEPVKKPYLNAKFVADQIAEQLVKRIPHKRVVRFAMDRVMSSQAKGVKVLLSGRIAGAEISRSEAYKRGTVPLSTIREEIDFASVPALTKSGYIGVKVWICK